MRVSITAVVIGVVACGDTGRQDTAAGGADATASMRDAAGKDLGTLRLAESGQSLRVSGKLTGLPPGEHGIHLHAVGQCDPSLRSGQAGPKFESAGDHWNPSNKKHGRDASKGPHFGDLPNLTVGQDGSVSVEATTPGGSLRGTNAALDTDGVAVVVHAKRDDYKTQPSGNSGDRIACGVVR